VWPVSKLRGKYFFGLLICMNFPVLSFVIVTTVVQATQLGRFINEATDALSHPPNTIVSHSVLRAFTEVSMVSSSVLHHTISLNSLISRIYLCRGSARVLDSWRFAVTVSDPSICPSPSHHRLLQQPLHHIVPAEEGRVQKHLYEYRLPTNPRTRSSRRKATRTLMCT
jgi:hypothetical protein